MTNRELKKLKRSELIELLLMQSREMDAMKEKMAALEEEVESRRLKLADTGSVAEAALRVTGIFDDAQKAADMYLENIRLAEEASRSMEEETRKKCESMETSTRIQCQTLEQETQKRCQELERKTTKKCGQQLRDAEKSSKEVWETIEARLGEYVNEHQELKNLLQTCRDDIASAERGTDEKEENT